MAGVKGRSGGARVGAGRKPLSRNDRWLRGKPGSATAPSAPSTQAGSVTMPEGLPEDVAAVWTRLAPRAVAQQTLDAARVEGFTQLCKLVALEAKQYADDRQGTSDHRGVVQRLDVALARFRLTGDGKPQATIEASRPVSALEQLQQQASHLRRVK